MENFYKITKYGDSFKIKRKYHYFPKLDLNRYKYIEVFQYKHAIIAQLPTSKYDFYLPSTICDSSSHQYQFVDCPLTLVDSYILEYLTYQDIFAFKKNSVWNFLLLHNFEMELELTEDTESSLNKRLAELPKIPCKINTVAFFKARFESLYVSNKHHLAVFHADKDYLINATEHEIPLSSSGIQINCLGLITKLPGGDGLFFKATYNEGEFWYHHQYSDGITYGSIEPMNENEYPAIYPNKNFFGYWKKNHDGLILGLAFLSNSDSPSFILRLPCIAKEVQFVKSINRVNLYDGTDMLTPATLWRITPTTDEVSFLLVSDNHYTILSPQDFTN